ncbi:MAG: 50S ribosomal protein L32 [Candidatus Firestonebacteria bacterium]|jgi:large subunit ribosomal protein L32|nr:50S ribosomal protein L32 [Candidatus Firestonebacteria bacterium]
MANPKRRFSASRRDHRRSQWKLKSPGLSVCPQCKQSKLPHRVCENCGYYGKKEVLDV